MSMPTDDDEGYEEALDRAIEICRTQKPEADRIQIKHMLERDPWEEVGRFAKADARCRAEQI